MKATQQQYDEAVKVYETDGQSICMSCMAISERHA